MSAIDPCKLKPGVHVMYHFLKGEPGKEYTVKSRPWKLHNGEWVVLLEGKSGCVLVSHISEILETALNSSCIKCDWCRGFIAFCGHPKIQGDYGLPADFYHAGGVLPNCPLKSAPEVKT